MTGEAQRLAGRLAEREVGFERDMERVRVAREEERGEVERLRREVEDGERRIRELEEAVEGLTKVKVTAEKKTQIVRCLSSGSVGTNHLRRHQPSPAPSKKTYHPKKPSPRASYKRFKHSNATSGRRQSAKRRLKRGSRRWRRRSGI